MSAPDELAPAELEEQTRVVRQLIPLFDAMELRVVRLGRGVAETEIPPGPNGNHFGVTYAGALFSVAEVLGGLLPAATWDVTDYLPIVADMQIRFRAPATAVTRASTLLSEDEIERVAAEIAQGAAKVWFTLVATLTDPDGAEVATTTGQYLLRRIKGSTPAHG